MHLAYQGCPKYLWFSFLHLAFLFCLYGSAVGGWVVTNMVHDNGYGVLLPIGKSNHYEWNKKPLTNVQTCREPNLSSVWNFSVTKKYWASDEPQKNKGRNTKATEIPLWSQCKYFVTSVVKKNCSPLFWYSCLIYNDFMFFPAQRESMNALPVFT